MKKVYIKAVIAAVFISILLGACSSKNYNSTLSMSETEKDFISKVRYIITKPEKKMFYKLATTEERKEFIEDFWKKRDPDPSTEENEYKEEYYTLIEEANHLFKDEKKQGWLTDRGRVFILLGPPELRRFRPGTINSSVNPNSIYDKPYEVWYYGFYPIIFVDRFENGSFELTPLGAQHIATILRTAMDWKPKIGNAGPGGKIPLDFNLKITSNKEGKVTVHVKVPYKNILFQQDKKGNFFVLLTLKVDVFTPKNKKVHSFSEDYSIKMTADELKAGEVYPIDTSFTLESGQYEVRTILESKSDDIKNQKNARISI